MVHWSPIPFVRLLLPFVIGITIGFYLPHPQVNTIAWLLCLFLGICCGWLAVQSKLSRPQQRRYGAAALLLWLCFGYTWTFHYDHRQSDVHFQHYHSNASRYYATAESPPQLYDKSFRLLLSLSAFQDTAGHWFPCTGKALVTFEIDTTAAMLRYGDQLILEANMQPITAGKNPYSFDPQWFYGLQNIHHRAYIPQGSWRLTRTGQGSWLWATTYQIRDRLLSILKKHLLSDNEYAVAAALLFGVRDELSAEIRNAYSDTGTTHILAVSGMHVGILAYIWGWLLGWWRPRRKGIQWLKTALLLGVIWIFVFLAGASPSVLRAGVMFSFICGAQTLRRQANIYNTLASSAFVLLCWNPYTLFDVGFQLSYLAVLGIVLLERKIVRIFYFKNWLLRWIWKMTAVSLAAQLATTPISLYYFHQFPLSFWLSGIIAIPLSSAALPLGMLLLAVDWVPNLGEWVGYILWRVIGMMNATIFIVQQIPGAVIKGIWLNRWEMILWYVVLVLGGFAMIQQRIKSLRISLYLLIVLGFGRWWRAETIARQSQVWAYHLPKGTLLTAISGTEAITLVDSSHFLPTTVDFVQQNHLWALGVQSRKICILQQDTVRESFVMGIFPHFQLLHTKIGVYGSSAEHAHFHRQLLVDYQIPHKARKMKYLLPSAAYLFDASNSQRLTNDWVSQCDSLQIPYRSVLQQGAQRIDISPQY